MRGRHLLPVSCHCFLPSREWTLVPGQRDTCVYMLRVLVEVPQTADFAAVPRCAGTLVPERRAVEGYLGSCPHPHFQTHPAFSQRNYKLPSPFPWIILPRRPPQANILKGLFGAAHFNASWNPRRRSYHAIRGPTLMPWLTSTAYPSRTNSSRLSEALISRQFLG
jgi:hypothetical protein